MKRLKRSLSKVTGTRKSARQASSEPSGPSELSSYIPDIPNSCKSKYDKLIRLKHQSPRYLNISEIGELGVGDDLKLINETCVWHCLLGNRCPDYHVLTVEFLSTLSIDEENGDRCVKFRVMNKNYVMSKTAFGDLFDFPRVDEYTFDRDFDQKAFWYEIAKPMGPGSEWKAGKSSDKFILNLSFRLAHRIMSEIMLPRKETQHLILVGELFALWCITQRRAPDSATLILDFLKKASNKSTGVICVGGLVTHITRRLGHNLDNRDMGQSYPPVAITRKGLANRHLLIPKGNDIYRVAMPWDEHRGVLWKAEYTIRDQRCWREVLENLEDESSDDGNEGEPDDEDAAQDDDDMEPATEAGNSDADMGDAGTPPRMSTAGASSSRAPRPSRRRPCTIAQLAADMHEMRMDQREFYKRVEDRWAAEDRRYSVSEGMYKDLYRHTFGHFYDPNNLHYPDDPPPPPPFE